MEVLCQSCPKCGNANVRKDLSDTFGRGYRVCRQCEQEWWVDIDYGNIHIDNRSQTRVKGR